MSGGFGNPIVGGGGALVYPSIHSPNFNVANPGASPNPSWAVLKNGLAYFFGLVLAGGTITGPDYIISPAGIFIYSGTPATGNLIGSWAGAAGNDGLPGGGNNYPQGFNISKGAISGTTITGTGFIINSAGAFFYSAAPALGNLVASSASSAGTDSFGNVYYSGESSYNPSGGATAFEVTQSAAGLISLGPGTTFAGGGLQPSTISSGGTGLLNIESGAASGADAQAGFTFKSKLTDGTSPLNLASGYIGLNPLVANPGATWPSLYADITTFTPSAGLQSGYKGALVVSGADANPHTVTQATATQLSKIWPIPGGDAQVLTVYRLTAAGTAGWGSVQQPLTLSLSAFGVANFASLPIGATEFTASLSLQWRLVADVVVVAPGNPGTIKGGMGLDMGVAGANQLTQVGTNQSAGGFGSHNGANATAVTTTAANITLQAAWASTTGAPTITCDYSYLERLGA
jgi:hypothetical protein